MRIVLHLPPKFTRLAGRSGLNRKRCHHKSKLSRALHFVCLIICSPGSGLHRCESGRKKAPAKKDSSLSVCFAMGISQDIPGCCEGMVSYSQDGWWCCCEIASHCSFLVDGLWCIFLYLLLYQPFGRESCDFTVAVRCGHHEPDWNTVLVIDVELHDP